MRSWASREWSGAKKRFTEGLGYRSYAQQQQRALVVVDAQSTAPSAGPRSRVPEPYLAAQARAVGAFNEAAARRQSARPFAQLLEELGTLPSRGAEDEAYRSLLRCLSCAAAEDSLAGPHPAGFFSPVALAACSPSPAADEDSVSERRLALTLGAARFLERQFEEHARALVQRESSAGRAAIPSAAAGDSRRQLIRSFARHQQSSARLPPECATSEGLPLWPLVFFCMRCGAVELARDEAERAALAGASVPRCVVALLSAYAALLAAPSAGAPSASDAIAECRAALQSQRREGGDPFLLAVLALLSCAEPGASIAVPGATLEDFLWSQLWCVSAAHLLGRGGAMAAQLPFGLSSGALTPSARFTEQQLFRCVLECGGAEHFDPLRAHPFNYALVLVACQRFGEAALHLWAAGRAEAAVHLLAGLLHHGLVLPHAPLSAPLLGLRGAEQSSGLTPCAVLGLWTKQLVDAGLADVAADYLASLSLRWVAFARGGRGDDAASMRCQLAVGEVLEQLLLNCDRAQLAQVVGAPLTEEAAWRAGGRLDAYMGAEDVDALLARAAYLRQRDGDRAGALHMYLLAGRVEDAMDVLCGQLLGALTAERGRAEALAAAKAFYSSHLLGGGKVMGRLQRGGRVALARTLEFLLKACSFVDLAARLEYKDALAVLDGLGVVARTEAEAGLCNQRLADLALALGPALDELLLRALDCCKELHRAARAAARLLPGVASDGDALCSDLRTRAKAMVLQAGLLGQRLARADTCGKLARAEVDLSSA